MHIPDGYLSPGTCAVLYAGAAPFWWGALRRVRRRMRARLVPHLSLLAAFSFVVMMFNIPLPGGTTGHAVGAALATIVLGPSASILAVSTALAIQAVFFGDGGITTLGANCFNIAIVGSLVAFPVYRLLAGRSALDSGRRVAAAGLAGYAAINASALVTAVELGLQPALFHDAAGAPLYGPYPLAVAVPVMMLGHLTFAGIAEFVLTGGAIAFVQRTDVALLAATAGPRAPGPADGTGRVAAGSLRPLWAALGALLVLTPLGLLAGGTAWGEWSAADLADPGARQAIAAASLHHALPAGAPSGLSRLAGIWSAPLPDYAPPLLRSPALGYLLSAMLGTGLVLLAMLGLTALLRPRGTGHAGDEGARS